jgi:hypothetical protein
MQNLFGMMGGAGVPGGPASGEDPFAALFKNMGMQMNP